MYLNGVALYRKSTCKIENTHACKAINYSYKAINHSYYKNLIIICRKSMDVIQNSRNMVYIEIAFKGLCAHAVVL